MSLEKRAKRLMVLSDAKASATGKDGRGEREYLEREMGKDRAAISREATAFLARHGFGKLKYSK